MYKVETSIKYAIELYKIKVQMQVQMRYFLPFLKPLLFIKCHLFFQNIS